MHLEVGFVVIEAIHTVTSQRVEEGPPVLLVCVPGFNLRGKERKERMGGKGKVK